MDNFDPRIAAQKFAAMEAAQAPRNQVPGMGSTANALPHSNPISDERQQRLSDAEIDYLMSKIYSGAGVAAAPFAMANPMAAIGAMVGAGGGLMYDRSGHLGEQAARRLQYQGN